MSAANPTRIRPWASARSLALCSVVALLVGVVAVAALHEVRKAAPMAALQSQERALAKSLVDSMADSSANLRPARSADEERFAQALWGIHSEVRTAAVRMTFAGLSYKMGDSDRASVHTKVAPLTAVFAQAESALGTLPAPVSMQELRARYASALQLYGRASQEMIEVSRDGKDAHLLKAHEMSERASGTLLEVGEQLWPGEIKPN